MNKEPSPHQQRTLAEKVSCEGIGLHSGRMIRLELVPAAPGHGICFVRTDLAEHPELPSRVSFLGDTRLATTLSTQVSGQTASVSTVEHLLSALYALGVDNVRVLIDGPEVPILDGSSAPFVALIDRAGIESQARAREAIVVRREVYVEQGNKSARITPYSGFRITSSLDFDHPLIPPAPLSFTVTAHSYRHSLARARTFGFLKDVHALQASGLALGGSLANAVVIDEYRVLNPEGLRFGDEFARHKILDAIGDLSLIGLPLYGQVTLHRSGHALNTELVKATLSDPRNYEIVTLGSPEAPPKAHLCGQGLVDVVNSIA